MTLATDRAPSAARGRPRPVATGDALTAEPGEIP
jgi:hypothetical protein